MSFSRYCSAISAASGSYSTPLTVFPAACSTLARYPDEHPTSSTTLLEPTKSTIKRCEVPSAFRSTSMSYLDEGMASAFLSWPTSWAVMSVGVTVCGCGGQRRAVSARAPRATRYAGRRARPSRGKAMSSTRLRWYSRLPSIEFPDARVLMTATCSSV